MPKTLVTQNEIAGINAPQGFMLNGKFVPSVTLNNLTVAIKTLAGADPSTSDPVYVRIGDAIRKITAPLSKVVNAGTNWMNAGSAELATQEIDYFVYLGYNATDGVVMGFSRIPYAQQYNDFSVTTTNEKYCAISTITNASANDNYENVGRFAATLSTGAGYTWSIPAFTPKNLIQRPTFETRILTWIPTVTGFVTHASTARYQVSNQKVFISIIAVSGVSNGTSLLITFPFNFAFLLTYSGLQCDDNSTRVVGYGKIDVTAGSNTGTVFQGSVDNLWTNVNNKAMKHTFTYEI